MSIEGNTSNLRAPEERNVYSKRESALVFSFSFLRSPSSGAHMFIATGAPHVFLFSEAPAGRHVYTCLVTQAPAGRQVNREARKLEREQAKLDA